MRGLASAVAFEALKFRRSVLVRAVSAFMGAGVPVLAGALFAASTSGGPGQLASKAAAMLPGTGWVGVVGATGQILSLTMLLGCGLAVCWVFGREFTDGTASALFALPVSRAVVAAAKF